MATLVYSDVDGVDRSFSLGADPVMVGRSAECAIRSEDPRVSRLHARFFIDQGAIWVEDLGSANGIYVGPNKVARAPVPIGEIVLVGSIMLRLLPASGTLPPPMGLHGTLAQWLEMERKARNAVEEERDAFAKRVGELHEELRAARDLQDAHANDAKTVRTELDELRRKSQGDLEHVRVEIAKAREAKMIAETNAGIQAAEKLAEADMLVASLRNEIKALKATQGAPAAPAGASPAELAAAIARAEKAEKELASAQIRAQGAERNLAGATTAAANADTRAAGMLAKLVDAEEARKKAEQQLAAAREQITGLEARAAAGDEPTKAAEARAAKLAAELAELTQQFETRRERLVELERAAQQAAEQAAAARKDADAAKAEVAAAAERAAGERAALEAKLQTAETRASALEQRLRDAAGAEREIEAARKERDEAKTAIARTEAAEQRANAADTMAKAMAKDVAEALRRAVEADTKARGVARELDGAHRRAEAAEKRDMERVAALREVEARAKDADAKIAALQQELVAKLDEAQQEARAKADALQQELGSKLEQAVRELAAERSTAMSLVDRKTQLERELSEARTQLAGLGHRLELAESKNAEYEVTIEQLDEKIQDLEAGVAVEQTASATSQRESKDKLEKLEAQLVEAKAAAKTATKTAAGLEKRVEALETQLAEVREARATAEAAKAGAEAALAEARAQLERALADARGAADAALVEARKRIAELEHAQEETVGGAQADRARADEAERKLREQESQLDPLRAKAEAADLAIGRAGALQRQLDEALQKLSWLERDLASGKLRSGTEDLQSDARVATAESRAAEFEARAKQAEAHAAAQQAHANDADVRAREAESRAAAVEQRSKEIEARAKDIEARAKEAAERIVEAERRAREAQAQLAEAERRAKTSEGGEAAELAEARATIAKLQREVDAADNVRKFAANTEREIAQLERDLRETKQKLAQATMERDRLESELRDVREDDETQSRVLGAPSQLRAAERRDPDVTAQADIGRYTALVARAAELEQKLVKLEKEDEKLRRQLADAEARAAHARDAEDAPTNTKDNLPLEFGEHLAVLEESIDSLRANMRAASDETAMMDQTESVAAISSAVSAAAEQVERARDSLRALTAIVSKR